MIVIYITKIKHVMMIIGHEDCKRHDGYIGYEGHAYYDSCAGHENRTCYDSCVGYKDCASQKGYEQKVLANKARTWVEEISFLSQFPTRIRRFFIN